MKNSLKILLGIVLVQPSYSFDDPNYLFIRAHSFERQNKISDAVRLYKQVIVSSISKKYKDEALLKISNLENINFLESIFKDLVRLENSDCFIVNLSQSQSLQWEGECQDGLAHGKGKLYETDQNETSVLVFDGKMKHGKKDSYGITYRPDQSVIYMGGFKSSQYNGEGKLYYKTGDLAYAGSFKNGRKTGNSKSFRPNGAMLYIGQYENNEFHGEGISYFEDGETYQGTVKNSLKDGYGIFTKLEGVIWDGDFSQGAFVGQWKHQIPQGLGAKHWALGAKYTGGWKDQKRHYKGTLTWPDGRVYSGDWKNDLRHGEGTLEYTDGTVYKGQFVEDKVSGIGELKLSDGSSYVGSFFENTFHGTGTWISLDGLTYQGQWINGTLDLSVKASAITSQELIKITSASKALLETSENGVILTQKPLGLE